MSERRSCIRWQIDRQAQVKLEAAPSSVACIIHDINFKGARISLKEELPLDKSLKLNIDLSREFSSFELEAWVAWHKTIDGYNLYGLYFTKIKDLDNRDSDHLTAASLVEHSLNSPIEKFQGILG